jgi:hypothetical protein
MFGWLGDTRFPEALMFHWLRRLLRRQAASQLPTITADVTGFTLTLQRESRAVPWQSVRKIAAFKQDLLTHDRVVMVIEVNRAGEQVLTLSEDSPGFATLFAPMEEALGINPSWYLEIMTPVLEPTPTVLYLRSLEEA